VLQGEIDWPNYSASRNCCTKLSISAVGDRKKLRRVSRMGCHDIDGKEIANHEVRTVTESGWSGLKNGELLALAEVEFDVFLTVDWAPSRNRRPKDS
jgi:hypothetical protein